MKSIIVGINAKYTHTALAARSIAAACAPAVGEVSFAEFTVNEEPDAILRALCEAAPDTILFSCYIWNAEITERLVFCLRAIVPEVKIFLGGPQVSFTAKETLEHLPIDGVISGEGEIAVPLLLEAIYFNKPLSSVPSLFFSENGKTVQTPPCPPVPPDSLPFCYEDLERLRGRVIYYESSRGCPFSCSYCLSGIDRAVRFKSVALVKRELKRFLAANVAQVKLCDRTFNCNPARAAELWRFLAEHDNGVTNFHFEIAADIITEEQMDILKAARPGLFQLEIGVQSLNPKTLSLVRRKTELPALFSVCRALRSGGNIHLHLDLIAGLPEEDFLSFELSFNGVYLLLPHALQLGFLKCLPGSLLREEAEQFDIIYRPFPPYEVLRTGALSADELFILKDVAEAVEQFHNSGLFLHSLAYAITFSEGGAFRFFLGLGQYLFERGALCPPRSVSDRLDFLFSFSAGLPGLRAEVLRELILYDLCLHSKPKKRPECLMARDCDRHYRKIRAFYESESRRDEQFPAGTNSAEARARSHIEVFALNPQNLAEARETALLFCYSRGETRVSPVYEL